jgi:hypothetical protein
MPVDCQLHRPALTSALHVQVEQDNSTLMCSPSMLSFFSDLLDPAQESPESPKHAAKPVMLSAAADCSAAAPQLLQKREGLNGHPFLHCAAQGPASY